MKQTLTIPIPTNLGYCQDHCPFLSIGCDNNVCNAFGGDSRPGPECVPGEYAVLPVAELAALRAEVRRQADVLDNCAQEYAEEQIRLESVISDMSNEARELRAEVERLRAALRRAILAMMHVELKTAYEFPDGYIYELSAALGAGKEDGDAKED